MKKICLTQLGRIGDMILLTPAIRAIDEKYPDSTIDIVAGRRNAGILRANPRVGNIIVFDKSPMKLPSAIVRLRQTEYDYYIDPKDHYSTESRLIAKMIRADKKIGFNPDGKKNFDIGIAGEATNTRRHIIARHFAALAPIGIPLPETLPRPELFPDDDSEKYVDDFLAAKNGEQFIVINISASQPKKMWPAEKWIEFIASIDPRGRRLIISYAPTERHEAESISRAAVNTIRFTSRSMADVVSLIRRCDLLVSPDTSLVHVAAAFDRPLAAMFAGLADFNAKFAPLCSRSELVFAEPGAPGIREIPVSGLSAAFDRIARQVL